MKSSTIKKKEGIYTKERIGITAIVMAAILMFFVILIIIVNLMQRKSIRDDSVETMRNSIRVAINIHRKENEQNSETEDVLTYDYNHVLKAAQPELSSDNKSEGDKTGFPFVGAQDPIVTVVLVENGETNVLIGDKEEDSDIISNILKLTCKDGDTSEKNLGDYYVGVYSGDFINRVILGIHNEEDKVYASSDRVYGAIDCSIKLANTKAMTKMLSLVTLIFFIILIPLVYWISLLVLKPSYGAMQKEKEFVANASHELKTPLAIITANATLVKESDPNNVQYADPILSQCMKMNETIVDMIDLSRLETSKPCLERCDVSELLESLCMEFDAVAFEKGLTYDYDIEPGFIIEQCDIKNVTRLFNLLIENSMKYCAGEEKRIHISLKKGHKNATLIFFNTGCDVKDENRMKIFDRFYQGDHGGDDERKGTGLGLAIVKQICKKYDFDIAVDSSYGGFMQFTLEMK